MLKLSKKFRAIIAAGFTKNCDNAKIIKNTPKQKERFYFTAPLMKEGLNCIYVIKICDEI